MRFLIRNREHRGGSILGKVLPWFYDRNFPPPTASICALHSRGIRKVCALLTSVVSSYINSIPTVESAERQKHVVHPFVEISQFFGLFFPSCVHEWISMLCCDRSPPKFGSMMLSKLLFIITNVGSITPVL